MRIVSPHSVRKRENADQKNSECGQFLCSGGSVAVVLIAILVIFLITVGAVEMVLRKIISIFISMSYAS